MIVYKPKAQRRLSDMPRVPNQEENSDLIHNLDFFPLPLTFDRRQRTMSK